MPCVIVWMIDQSCIYALLYFYLILLLVSYSRASKALIIRRCAKYLRYIRINVMFVYKIYARFSLSFFIVKNQMAATCWWYYIAKFTEFFDTFFFNLRKKTEHVSTLHVIHHGCMPFSVWLGLKFAPGKKDTL